jgi:hypothetical protein
MKSFLFVTTLLIPCKGEPIVGLDKTELICPGEELVKKRVPLLQQAMKVGDHEK